MFETLSLVIKSFFINIVFIGLFAVFVLAIFSASKRYFLALGLVLVSLTVPFFYAQSHRLIVAEPEVLPGELPPEQDLLVVLGGVAFSEVDLPESQKISNRSLLRVAEAVRIFHSQKLKPIVVFAGQYGDSANSVAYMNYQAALSLGLPEERALVLRGNMPNTCAEALTSHEMMDSLRLSMLEVREQNYKDLEKIAVPEVFQELPRSDEAFLYLLKRGLDLGLSHALSLGLVTDALHMQRAYWAFTRLPVQLKAFISDGRLVGHYSYPVQAFIPSAQTLVDWQRLVYEVLGSLWYRYLKACQIS